MSLQFFFCENRKHAKNVYIGIPKNFTSYIPCEAKKINTEGSNSRDSGVDFKCLNNLVPKYLTEYFTGNKAFHDYGTRRSNDLHSHQRGSEYCGGGGGVHMSVVGCRLKFHYFVGCRLKFSTFVGCR